MDSSSTDRNIKIAIVVGTVVAFVVLLGELYLLPETWLVALFAAACVVTIRRRGPNRVRNTAIAAALGVACVIGVNRFITYNIEVVNQSGRVISRLSFDLSNDSESHWATVNNFPPGHGVKRTAARTWLGGNLRYHGEFDDGTEIRGQTGVFMRGWTRTVRIVVLDGGRSRAITE